MPLYEWLQAHGWYVLLAGVLTLSAWIGAMRALTGSWFSAPGRRSTPETDRYYKHEGLLGCLFMAGSLLVLLGLGILGVALLRSAT